MAPAAWGSTKQIGRHKNQQSVSSSLAAVTVVAAADRIKSCVALEWVCKSGGAGGSEKRSKQNAHTHHSRTERGI